MFGSTKKNWNIKIETSIFRLEILDTAYNRDLIHDLKGVMGLDPQEEYIKIILTEIEKQLREYKE
jgi:hypothetical protein